MLFRRPKIPPPRPPDLPFDEAGRDALGGATDVARAAHASAVHAEHLLLAMLVEEGSVAARALAGVGVEAANVRRRVERASPTRPWGLATPVLPIADDLKGAIEHAMREGRAMGLREIGTGPLLLGVLQSTTGVPYKVVRPGIDLEALRAAVVDAMREDRARAVGGIGGGDESEPGGGDR